MAFTEGFWAADTVGNVANMNACLLGWGPKADFPAAAAGNKGRVAWATDEELLYYSNGSAWVAWPFINALAQSITGIKTFGSIPVLPASNPTTINQAVRKAYVETNVTYADATLRNSNDTEKSTASQALTKIKEVSLGAALGSCRIKFDLKSSIDPTEVEGRIYKNGVAVGTLRTEAGNVYVTYSEDLTGFVSGDLIQIYARAAGGGGQSAYVQNMRFYYSRHLTIVGDQTLVTPLGSSSDLPITITNQDP